MPIILRGNRNSLTSGYGNVFKENRMHDGIKRRLWTGSFRDFRRRIKEVALDSAISLITREMAGEFNEQSMMDAIYGK